MEPHGPFLNLTAAAAYCGWAPRYFAKLLKEYDVPRFGPRKNRFATTVLDAFMATPEAFKRTPVSLKKRRRTPIKIVVPQRECAS
ncbi:DNA-binding protein [Desulfarculus baarsii]